MPRPRHCAHVRASVFSLCLLVFCQTLVLKAGGDELFGMMLLLIKYDEEGTIGKLHPVMIGPQRLRRPRGKQVRFVRDGSSLHGGSSQNGIFSLFLTSRFVCHGTKGDTKENTVLSAHPKKDGAVAYPENKQI